MYMLFFFFFQAEDGIRDYKVTGVQTCALPILRARLRRDRPGQPPGRGQPGRGDEHGVAVPGGPGRRRGRYPRLAPAGRPGAHRRGRVARDGRARPAAAGGVRAGHRRRVHRGLGGVPRPLPDRLAAGGRRDPRPPVTPSEPERRRRLVRTGSRKTKWRTTPWRTTPWRTAQWRTVLAGAAAIF